MKTRSTALYLPTQAVPFKPPMTSAGSFGGSSGSYKGRAGAACPISSTSTNHVSIKNGIRFMTSSPWPRNGNWTSPLRLFLHGLVDNTFQKGLAFLAVLVPAIALDDVAVNGGLVFAPLVDFEIKLVAGQSPDARTGHAAFTVTV